MQQLNANKLDIFGDNKKQSTNNSAR